MQYYEDRKEKKRFAIIPKPKTYRGMEKNTEREQKRRVRQFGSNINAHYPEVLDDDQQPSTQSTT